MPAQPPEIPVRRPTTSKILSTDPVLNRTQDIGNRAIEALAKSQAAQTAQRVEVNDSNYSVPSVQFQFVALVALSAARTVTIPAPSQSNKGQQVVVKDEAGKAGTSNVKIVSVKGTIDGANSLTISTNYGVIRLYSSGVGWFSW